MNFGQRISMHALGYKTIHLFNQYKNNECPLFYFHCAGNKQVKAHMVPALSWDLGEKAQPWQGCAAFGSQGSLSRRTSPLKEFTEGFPSGNAFLTWVPQSEWAYWVKTGKHFMVKGNCICWGVEQSRSGEVVGMRTAWEQWKACGQRLTEFPRPPRHSFAVYA